MLSCSWIGHLCFCLKHKHTNIILHNPLDVKIEMQNIAAKTPSCPHPEEEVPEGPRLSLLPFGLTASDILSVFGMPQSTSVWQVNFQIDFFPPQISERFSSLASVCISNTNKWQNPFWKYPSFNKLCDESIPFLCWRTYPGIVFYKTVFVIKILIQWLWLLL